MQKQEEAMEEAKKKEEIVLEEAKKALLAEMLLPCAMLAPVVEGDVDVNNEYIEEHQHFVSFAILNASKRFTDQNSFGFWRWTGSDNRSGQGKILYRRYLTHMKDQTYTYKIDLLGLGIKFPTPSFYLSFSPHDEIYEIIISNFGSKIFDAIQTQERAMEEEEKKQEIVIAEAKKAM